MCRLRNHSFVHSFIQQAALTECCAAVGHCGWKAVSQDGLNFAELPHQREHSACFMLVGTLERCLSFIILSSLSCFPVEKLEAPEENRLTQRSPEGPYYLTTLGWVAKPAQEPSPPSPPGTSHLWGGIWV